MKIHENYINRCIQLAKNGLGNTYPNPLVGSVIVVDDKIIGEGWHQKAGEAHAEVNAINSVREKSLLKKATLYVSLEPCSHFGKTPPCSDLIIAMGIKKVVIGMVDPFSEVSGRGIKKLMDAGCEVVVGILEKECAELNRRFLTFHLKKRPFIILKWAQTQDNFIAPSSERQERAPVWISNSYSKQMVHKWRAEEQAILAGTNTIIADNPNLTTRLWKGNHPARIILDQRLRIPKDSNIYNGSTETLVLTGKSAPEVSSEKKEVSFEKIDFSGDLASEISSVLWKNGFQSVIIEGGKKTVETFIAKDLWDEARIFTGNSSFKKGIRSPEISGRLISERKIGSDTLKILRND